jgi:hypothetical protein
MDAACLITRRRDSVERRVVNNPTRRVLGLPIATPLGGRLMLVFLTGRKTSKA